MPVGLGVGKPGTAGPEPPPLPVGGGTIVAASGRTAFITLAASAATTYGLVGTFCDSPLTMTTTW